MSLNTDILYGQAAADPVTLRQEMYKVISVSQDHPEVQLQAIAMCLYALCEALDVDIRRLLTMVERMKNEMDGPFVYVFRSVEEYARNEIGGRR